MDADARALERKLPLDPSLRAQHLQQRLRRGDLVVDAVRLSAYAGDEAAQLVVGFQGRFSDRDLREALAGLQRWRAHEVLLRAVVAAAWVVIEIHEVHTPPTPPWLRLGRQLTEAAEHYLDLTERFWSRGDLPTTQGLTSEPMLYPAVRQWSALSLEVVQGIPWSSDAGGLRWGPVPGHRQALETTTQAIRTAVTMTTEGRVREGIREALTC